MFIRHNEDLKTNLFSFQFDPAVRHHGRLRVHPLPHAGCHLLPDLLGFPNRLNPIRAQRFLCRKPANLRQRLLKMKWGEGRKEDEQRQTERVKDSTQFLTTGRGSSLPPV
jgi:hypothetical protein